MYICIYRYTRIQVSVTKKGEENNESLLVVIIGPVFLLYFIWKYESVLISLSNWNLSHMHQ